MALSNAEKQKLHRQRQKEKLSSPVMTVMEQWLEQKTVWLRNRASEHIAKGRDVRFVNRANHHFCYFQSVGYVTDQIDGSVFLYMELKGYICHEGKNPMGINEDLYRLAPVTD